MKKLAVALVTLALAVSCRGTVESGGERDLVHRDDGANNGGSNNGANNGGSNNGANNGANNGVNNGANNGGSNNGANNGANNGRVDMGGADLREPEVDLGTCNGAGFAEELVVVPVANTTASTRLHAVANPNGAGALLGWSGGGMVTVTHVDAAGSPFGEEAVAGDEIFGLAASPTGHAVLVSRAPDILALVIFDTTGAVVSDQTVIGGVDHDVTDNEWFGPLIRHGRLIWTGAGWAAYYPVQRLWNDGIQHYGDQLRVYEPDGSSSQTIWGWGCSHSMDLRISHNGDRLGPICSSDCYPSKGVHFNHRGGELYPDESGSNCAGGFGTTIGASIPVSGGFWATFTAVDNRNSSDVALVHIDGTTPGAPVWLTGDAVDDSALNAVMLDAGLLVAWNSAGASQFVLFDTATSAVVEGPVTAGEANLGTSSDFFRYENGDAGWAQRATDGSVAIARLRSCP